MRRTFAGTIVPGVPSLLSDTDLFARLIAFDTTSRLSNLAVADFLCDYLDRPRVRITRNPSADGEKTNLVVEIGPEVDPEAEPATRRPVTGDPAVAVASRQGTDTRQLLGPGLALSAHMDVVPAGDGWESDPFTLTDGGDRWFGRGTADMKGFLALAVNAAAELASQAAGDTLPAPLALVLTYDEELGCLGAKRLADTWPRERPLPGSAVIGEPTSLRAVRLHKGHLKMRVTVRGKSAHSGYPHLGANAIEPAARVVVALSALRRQLESERPRHGEHFPETPFVALNVGRIEGGTAINVVPDRCTVEVGLRPLPEMDSAALAGRVREAVAGVAPEGRVEVEMYNDTPSMLLPEEAPIYRAVCDLSGQRETVAASYGTDAGWLACLGLDCVVFGPGTIEVAHQPNESMPKAEFFAAREALARLIDRFCRAA